MRDTNRRTIIEFPNKNLSIETGIEEGSMDLSEILCSGDDIEFGEFNCDKFEVTIYGIDDVIREEIIVTQSVIDSRGNNVIYPLFRGYVDSCEYDENLHYRQIVAYNGRLKKDDVVYVISELDVSNWWNNYWYTLPVIDNIYVESTAYDLFIDLMETFEIPYINRAPYYDATIRFAFADDDNYYRLPELNNFTMSNMLKMIGELLLAIPHMTRDGRMALKYICEPLTVMNEQDNLERLDTKYETYTVPKISGFYVGCSDRLNDNGKGGYGQSDEICLEPANNSNPYMIKDNFLIHAVDEDLQLFASKLRSRAGSLSYVPVQMKTIISDLDVVVGTKVNSQDRISIVFENHLSGTLLIEQELISRGSPKRTVELPQKDNYVESSKIGGVNILTNSKLMTDYTIKQYLCDENSNRLTDGTSRLYI